MAFPNGFVQFEVSRSSGGSATCDLILALDNTGNLWMRRVDYPHDDPRGWVAIALPTAHPGPGLEGGAA